MAVATETIVVDGQIYHAGDTIPDLGSLVATSTEANKRNYEGKYADKAKLPKYDNLATGSSALLSDGGTFKYYKYYADTKTWEGEGEVL